MKRKLFCLLTLLLAVCSGAWADTKVYSWEGASSGATQTGGTVAVSEGSSSSDAINEATSTVSGTFYVIKLQSKADAKTGYTYITLNQALNEGDQVKISGFQNKNASDKQVNIKLLFYQGDTSKGNITEASSANWVNLHADYATATEPETKTFDVTSTLAGSNIIRIARSTSGTNLWISKIEIIRPESKTVTSEEFAGVKVNGTEIASAKYSIVGNVITLVDSYLSAPTVELINHITYSDSSTDNQDVAVSLGGLSEGFFSGTATIGETTYTVKVPHNDTATLEADKASVTVASPKMVTGSVTIHLTGANLTGENVSVAFASSVAGLSVDKASIAIADGAVNADVIVSYKSVEAVAEANVNLVISTEGVSNIVIPVTYSSTAAVTELETISGTTDWNWNNTGQASNVASPDASSYVVFSNVDGWDAGFNAAAISGKASYLAYGSMTQANGLKIKTSVPGTITVKFSNTGDGDRPYRWLAVNGTVLDYKSKDQTVVTTENISVPAGEVLIESIMGTTDADAKPEYVAANAMFNFRQLTFTEADVTAPTLSSSTPANGATDVATSGTIVLTFSEAIESVDDSKFTLTGATKGEVAIDGEDATKVNVAYSGAGFSSTVTLAVAAEAVEDAAGNMSAALSDISFTTGEKVISVKAVFKFTAKSDWNNSNYQTVSPITATFTKNAEAQYVKYSNGNTLVIAATGAYVITKIELGYVSGYLPGTDNITVSSGYGEINSAGTEWNGFAQSVTLTKGSGDARVNSLSVTYSEAVTITPANDMSTYVTPAALDFSGVDGLTAYVATGKGTGTVVMSPVAAVPADTPLLLVGTAGTPYSVPVAAEADAPGTNYLKKGPQTFTGEEEDKYILWTDGKFHLVAAGTLAANKAYLDLAEAGARELSIIFENEGETTALSEVRGLKADVRGEFYDLSGRKVAQPTKGLYIVNGRKVVIK